MVLQKCCCCVPLRAGTFTIAILYLVFNCLLLLPYTVFACFNDHTMTYIILAVVVPVCSLNIAVNSLLLHELRRNRRKLMLPWLVWYAILKTLLTLTWLGASIWVLVVFYEALKHGTKEQLEIFFCLVTWLPGLISLPVMWYWYACVHAYYRELSPSDTYTMAAL